jgi:hypothetical protein
MQAEFKVNMRAWWSKDGQFEIFKSVESAADVKQDDSDPGECSAMVVSGSQLMRSI